MSDNKITIEVDGQTLEAERGQMLIEVTDKAGIYIPRFCYHEKLSVAANCRMCLVEMEKGRKPMPACATPVADGNKFFTRSKAAIEAQRATMEFLLINHPLDCPICDQGGECELQDLAMGYGRGISRYAETKRAVDEKELGPLVSTDMTRCIHCTRCVRFGEEIAGLQELGTIGRGENVEIAPYIEKTIDHELSGNIIDVCPVGALNSKPFRFRARSWEMTQSALVSPHDSFGSNLNAHIARGQVMRVVPRNNEDINETWISDRDRFSYEGLTSDQRLTKPMVKVNDEWHETSWGKALQAAAKGVRSAITEDAGQLGVMAAPWSTVEELHVLERMTRGLGCANLDHRLRHRDFSGQNEDAVYPGINGSIADLEQQEAIVLLGCRMRQEVPMLAHRIRKAASAGAAVFVANSTDDEYLLPLQQQISGNVFDHAAAIASASGATVSNELQNAVQNARVSDAHRELVASLKEKQNAAIILGHAAQHDARYGAIRALASATAKATGATLKIIGDAANSAGAALLGVLPHRRAGGAAAADTGLNMQQMFDQNLRGYLLFNFEPELDCAGGASTLTALQAAESVVCVSNYVTDTMLSYANVLLPLASFAESAGTYINCEGRWQSFTGVIKPAGDARPGWKILRVLANHLDLDGFEFNSPDELLDTARQWIGETDLRNEFPGNNVNLHSDGSEIAEPGLYDADPIVRRSQPLQDIGKPGDSALKATG